MQYSVRQKQPAFNNADKGTTNKTLSPVLTLFLKFSCSLSLQIPPTYSISTFSLKYELILTHNFSNVNIYLIDILFSGISYPFAHALFPKENHPSYSNCCTVLAKINTTRSTLYSSKTSPSASCAKCIPSKFFQIASSIAFLQSKFSLKPA